MTKVAEHTFSRFKVSVYSIGIGLLIGIHNSIFHPIDLTFNAVVLISIGAAIVSIVVLHEAIHAAFAVLFGAQPVFGMKPPLVYVTFSEKIPRGRFIVIALAPLVVLDAAFVILFSFGVLKVFSYCCLIINTLGSVGDLWMAFKIFPHERGTLIQDTKTGIEVWYPESTLS
jgi:hypothetical protein